MTIQERVRANIEMWMNLRKLRPIDLAEKSKLNKAHISMILSGKTNLSLSTLARLAEGLDVKPHLPARTFHPCKSCSGKGYAWQAPMMR